jgi:hypothetical protein
VGELQQNAVQGFPLLIHSVEYTQGDLSGIDHQFIPFMLLVKEAHTSIITLFK